MNQIISFYLEPSLDKNLFFIMASTASRLLEVSSFIEFWNVAKALLIIFCYLESQEDFFQVANSEGAFESALVV